MFSLVYCVMCICERGKNSIRSEKKWTSALLSKHLQYHLDNCKIMIFWLSRMFRKKYSINNLKSRLIYRLYKINIITKVFNLIDFSSLVISPRSVWRSENSKNGVLMKGSSKLIARNYSYVIKETADLHET